MKGQGAEKDTPQEPPPRGVRLLGCRTSATPGLRSRTLFLLTAELGHSRSRDSEELCSSLHTCHRKWRKEPPADRRSPVSTATCPPPCPARCIRAKRLQLRCGAAQRKLTRGPRDPGSNPAASLRRQEILHSLSQPPPLNRTGTVTAPTAQASCKDSTRSNADLFVGSRRLRAHSGLPACVAHVCLLCPGQGPCFTQGCSLRGPGAQRAVNAQRVDGRTNPRQGSWVTKNFLRLPFQRRLWISCKLLSGRASSSPCAHSQPAPRGQEALRTTASAWSEPCGGCAWGQMSGPGPYSASVKRQEIPAS